MANTNTPKTTAETNAQVEDTVQNPTTTSPGSTHGSVFHVSIVHGPGITTDPNKIYDAIAAAYTNCATNKGTVARNTMILRVDS
jgi:hypothetical protein